MSRKSKIDPALKVELRDEIGIMEGCRMAGLSSKTAVPFKRWVNIYKNEWPYGLLDQKKSRLYPKEVKLDAVNVYLNGEGSGIEIARRFGLRLDSQLRGWIRVYSTYGEINCRGSDGGSYMRKGKETTDEERLKIVLDSLANDKNYGLIALKYRGLTTR